MQVRKFKIRCSAIGEIMTEPKKKGEALSGTCKSYLEEWVKSEVYNRNKEISNKYMDKGNECESDAIEFVSNVLGWDFAVKNEQFYRDEHFTGTPDILIGDSVEDIKCSWDCFTFPLFDKELPNKKYFYQLQGYMALTGKKTGGINYCLMDASEDLINKECKKRSYSEGNGGKVSAELYDEVRSKMIYSNLPKELRHKRFEVKRDEDVIKLIRERVELCRIYINETIFKNI
jgi:hypothetical protein